MARKLYHVAVCQHARGGRRVYSVFAQMKACRHYRLRGRQVHLLRYASYRRSCNLTVL